MTIMTDKKGNTQYSRGSGLLIILAHLYKGVLPDNDLTITWPWVVLVLVLYGFNKLAFAIVELIKYLKGGTPPSG